MRLIWSTRGLTWGYRFLSGGGLADPLPVFEAAFAGMPGDPEAWQIVDEAVGRRFGTGGEMRAFRFPDPLDRRDRAGRVIRHEFVAIQSDLQDDVVWIESAEDGRRIVWEEAGARFDATWRLPKAPPMEELKVGPTR